MASGILSVEQQPFFEDSITHFSFHSHAPYATTRYGNNDEIRVPIQQQDVFTPVSYTHLDVYKRQEYYNGGETAGKPRVHTPTIVIQSIKEKNFCYLKLHYKTQNVNTNVYIKFLCNIPKFTNYLE